MKDPIEMIRIFMAIVAYEAFGLVVPRPFAHMYESWMTLKRTRYKLPAHHHHLRSPKRPYVGLSIVQILLSQNFHLLSEICFVKTCNRPEGRMYRKYPARSATAYHSPSAHSYWHGSSLFRPVLLTLRPAELACVVTCCSLVLQGHEYLGQSIYYVMI